MRYYLGADLGGTKTHLLIADESGQIAGFGEAGPGNHETVGFEGMLHSLQTALSQALQDAKLPVEAICGAGFGIAGYDWASERKKMIETVSMLALKAPFTIVNDTIPGLVAGAEDGWGVVVVSGTGCNCRGWDRERKREGRVTGHGILMGEASGASEMVFRAMQLVNYAWIKRGAETALTQMFLEHSGARDLEDLIEGYTQGYYSIDSSVAPLIFRVAEAGDGVARQLIGWAGCELGEMANAVIHQLEFKNLQFDVVLSGSMFENGSMLIDPMRATIHKVAPGARLVRLTVPPVIGAVLIGMSDAGLKPNIAIRKTLVESIDAFRKKLTENNA